MRYVDKDGFHTSKKEQAMLYWHSLTPEERLLIMESAPYDRNIHRRFINCLEYLIAHVLEFQVDETGVLTCSPAQKPQDKPAR